MTKSESFAALRRANLRAETGFEEAVAAAAGAVRAGIATTGALELPRIRSAPRGRVVRASAAGATLAAVAGVALSLTVWSPGGGPEHAAAAVKQAATLSAARAEESRGQLPSESRTTASSGRVGRFAGTGPTWRCPMKLPAARGGPVRGCS